LKVKVDKKDSQKHRRKKSQDSKVQAETKLPVKINIEKRIYGLYRRVASRDFLATKGTPAMKQHKAENWNIVIPLELSATVRAYRPSCKERGMAREPVDHHVQKRTDDEPEQPDPNQNYLFHILKQLVINAS